MSPTATPTSAQGDAAAPALLELPLDRPRAARRAPGTVSGAAPCPAAIVGDERLALAVTAAWLRRVTGQDDLVVTIEDAQGHRPVRVDAAGDPTFGELAARVDEAIAAAAGEPALDAMALPEEGIDGQVVVCTGGAGTAGPATELCVSFQDAAVRLDGAATLFERTSLVRLAGHLSRIAAAVARGDADGERVSALPLLGDAEREQLLHGWNATARPFSDGACVHELIAARAAEVPERTAVVFGAQRLTYAELEARANRLAHHLVEVGVTAGSLVGVHLDRSHEMVVAVLAIMKAGAGYVPLDPSFPPDRLAYMVEDSGLGVLVTESALSGRLRLPGGVREVRVDGDRAAIEARPATAPETGVGCRDTIYVIYTSGSTGKPKGVVLEHRSVVNFLETMAVEPGLEPDDVLLAVTTLSFDIAGLELYLPLLRGATVVVADRATTTDPTRLLEALGAHGVTVMQATPATWRMLVDGGWEPGATPALRAFCGGEALPPALAEQLVARAAEAWNLYGPTETTIWSTVQRVQPGAPVSIGRAIANTTLYVLDGRLQPVPIGVAGELLIGGDGLARGYHDRAELTAEKFVADPFSERPDARLYRTGDLVRWRADGRIEFIGRVDHQVKVRGFRIELGEIEAVLGRQPAVEEAVVLAVDDDRGQKQLVAYVTPAAGAQASRTELRRAVGDDLPNYMVPALVVVLDAMPRTPNGKTDRKALPAPDFTDVEREAPFTAPRNDTERRLVALWEETLGITPIGVDDDLFALGVDSLTTARLVGRMEHAFKVDLPVGTVFSAPTPAALAELLSAGVQKPRWRSLVVITPEHPGSTSPPLFCVHGGAGTVLLYADLARRLGPDRPVYALHAQGLYGHDAVHTSIAEMAAAYVRQIREVQPHGPYAIIGYCFGGHVAHEMGVLLREAGETIDLVGYINAPSVDYIREHDPWFDEVGALTGEGGVKLREPYRATVAGPPRRPQPVLVRRARRKIRHLRFQYALRCGRPLPQFLREELSFQYLARRAEGAYVPRRLDAAAVAWRAEGMYFADDLGWGPFVGGELHCVEVPGPQPIPRITMNEPFVSHIADSILALREDPAMASDAAA